MYRDIILQIIDAAINSKTLDLSNYINDQEFMRIMKEQTFLPFLYKVDKRKEFRKYYYQSCLIHEKFNEVGKIVDDILTQNNIPHVFLKGYELQNIYPDPNLRMLGDIDLLVPEDKYNLSIDILKNNGFIGNEENGLHIELYKDNVEIELHHKLVNEGRYDEFFFRHPFDNLKDNSNHFNDNYNFLYIIAHYTEHIVQGAGLRPLIDIYLMLKKYNLDFEYINKSLKSMGLDKFYNMILNEISIIFNYNEIPFTKNKQVLDMIDYSLKSGIHGFGHEAKDSTTKNIERENNGNKIKKIFKSLFIPLKRLFELYPWSKLIITIPFAYLFRFFYLLKNRRNKLKETISYKQDDSFKLLQSLGLYSDDKYF